MTRALSTRGLVAAFLALLLSAWLVAAPAIASEGADNRSDRAEQAGDNRSDRADAQGDNRTEPHGEPTPQATPTGEEKGASQDAPHGHAYGHESAPPEHARGDAETRGGEDRDGEANRGSVKIRDDAYAWPPRNEPHVTCDFTIVFHGFDAGERDFWIHLHPPTADGAEGRELVLEASVTLAETRGNDVSAEYDVAWTTLEETGLFTEDNRHPQQGWHLKLTVDGPKHKVFWIDCPQPETEGEVVTEGELVVEEEAFGEVVVGVAAGHVVEEEEVAAVDATEEADVEADLDADVEVLAAGDDVDEVEAAAADELPVTGGPIALVALLGALLSALGAGALRLTRSQA